jgi:hypothetical protein
MPILSCPVPENISVLNPNGFLFSIQKFPELTYFVQEASLPSINIPSVTFANSVHDLAMPGETMTFDEINVSFLVDDKMANYQAIQEWIFGLGFPAGHKYYTNMLNSARNANSFSENSKAVSDSYLTVLDANNMPLKRFEFVDSFPTSLSALTFQSTNSDVQYLVATVTLAYSYYHIN